MEQPWEPRMTTTLDEVQMKVIFKQALTELLQERKGLLYEAVEDIVEDIALVRAIREGQGSGRVSRDEALRALESKS
jgi:hypothetical protein